MGPVARQSPAATTHIQVLRTVVKKKGVNAGGGVLARPSCRAGRWWAAVFRTSGKSAHGVGDVEHQRVMESVDDIQADIRATEGCI